MAGSIDMIVKTRDGRHYRVDFELIKGAVSGLASSGHDVSGLPAGQAATEALEYLLARQPFAPGIKRVSRPGD
jgi:hypothetical protein